MKSQWDLEGKLSPQTPSPKPQASRVIMPAKKSTAVATATVAAPTAMPASHVPTGFPLQFAPGMVAPPQFQFATGFAPQGYQFGSTPATGDVSAPIAPSFFAPPQLASIPMAQAVAIPQPVSQTTANPIELMEAQMKAMKDYIANMEKTFKEAKKGMKKPRIPKDPNAPKNPIPEGTQAWNDFVVLVQKEESDNIRATDATKAADWKGITRKEAMAKAKELKAAGDPRYNYVKKEKPATTSPAAATADAAEPKKRGRKPKNAAALPAPALPPTASSFAFPTMTAALPLATAADEAVEVEEIVINGATYLMTSKKECWNMLPDGDQGAWAGIYNGSIIVPAPEPSN